MVFIVFFFFFVFKHKTAYEIYYGLVGSEMCIRDRFLTVQQVAHLIEVMLVGVGGHQAVGQAAAGIDTNMGLHAKVPLIAFLGLMHLRIALLLVVLGGAGAVSYTHLMLPTSDLV